MKPKCGNCGSKKVESKDQYSKGFPFRDYPLVFLETNLKIKECLDCGELVISLKDSKNLNEAILNSINININKYINIFKERGIKQKELAKILGVSPEYLSEIKSGRKQPAFLLFNFLKTLAYSKESLEIATPDFNTTKEKLNRAG